MAGENFTYKTTLQFTVDGAQGLRGAAQDIKQVEAALAGVRRTATARTASAYETLGLRSIGQVQADILKVRAALSTLRASNAGPAELARASEAARAKLVELNAELRKVGPASADGTRSATGDLVKMAAAAISVREALQGVKAIVASGIASERETSLFSLGSGGDAAAIGDSIAFARAEAYRLGLDLRVVSEELAKVEANTKGTAAEGQAARDIFSGIAEYARVSYLSTDQLKSVFVATNQVLQKGTVYAEELFSQFGERAIRTAQIAAESMGLTVAELRDVLSKGGVDSIEFLTKFTEGMRRAAAGSLDGAVESTQANLTRMANAFEEFQRRIASSGLFEALNKEIDRFLEKLDTMADTGELQQFASDLASIIGGAVELFGAVARAAVEFRDEIGLLIKALAGLYVGGKVIAGLEAMAVAFRATGAAAGVAAAGVGGFWAVIKKTGVVAVGLVVIELAQWLFDVAKAAQQSGQALDEWKTVVANLASQNAEYQGEYRRSVEELSALSREELEIYRKRIEAAKTFYEARGAELAQAGDTANAQAFGDQARAYEEHLRDIKAAADRRVEIERQLATNTAAVRRGMLSELEAALAAEKKALQAANADLQRASNERKSIAQSYRQLVIDLGTPKIGGGGELSLGDASAAVLRAEAASAQAANLTGDAAQRKAQDAKRLADEAKKTLEQLAQEDAQRETRKYNAGDFKYLAERLERAANKAAVVDQDVAQAKAAEAEAKLKTLEARIAALGEPINLQLETDPNNLTAIRQAIEEKLRGITVQVSPSVADPAAPADIPKRAYGGPLPGYSPHDRADNLLFMGTAGEWVLDRPTRRYYGDAFLRQLMSRQIPRFAFGGPLGGLEMPRLSEAAVAPSPALQPANLTVPGVGTYPVQAAPDVVAAMERDFYLRALATGHRG